MRIEARMQLAESMRELADESRLAAHGVRRLCTLIGRGDVDHILSRVALDLSGLSGRIQVSATELESQRERTQSMRQLAAHARMAAFAVSSISRVAGPGNVEDDLMAVARDLARLSGRMATTAHNLERG